MRVLLVEDHADLRSLFTRMLRAHGFEVDQAANGQEALDQVTECEPDLVITDLWMPVLDGLEFTRRLHARATTVALPVVAITADGSYETERRAREAGAIDVLVKPVDIGDLIDRLYGLGESARLRGR